MEELDFDLGELEAIEKQIGNFPYPVVHFGSTVYFNTKTRSILGNASKIRWFTTPEYVVCLPTEANDTKGFTLLHYKNGRLGLFGAFPVALRNDKKLSEGFYKLFKYKNGVAFKRYEPITND